MNALLRRIASLGIVASLFIANRAIAGSKVVDVPGLTGATFTVACRFDGNSTFVSWKFIPPTGAIVLSGNTTTLIDNRPETATEFANVQGGYQFTGKASTAGFYGVANVFSAGGYARPFFDADVEC